MREIVSDTDELFVMREETLDGVEDMFGPSFFILLRNFPLNAAELRAAHVEVLRERVKPYIDRRPGFCEIYGMTDRSGSRKINYEVGAKRVAAVQTNLRSLGAEAPKIDHVFVKAIGEDFFEDRHDRNPAGDKIFVDGKKDGSFRSVVIALTPAPIGVPTRLFLPGAASDTVSFCRQHRKKG
jgi:hypothetical protein